MNRPVPVPVPVSIWLVCKLCRGSFHDVTAFLAHKTEKHFDEFKTVKSIIFEEQGVKDDVDIDSNPESSTEEMKENVLFDVESSYTNPIESDKSFAEADQRQVYTCKFTNPNQENAVDFTIEDECVIINISRLNPNLAESISAEQVNSEAVYEFEYGDDIEILEYGQQCFQPDENSEKNSSATSSKTEEAIYQGVDADVESVETEDISHKDVLTSNEAFEIEAGEVNIINANSAPHDSSTSQLEINSDPTNIDAQIPVSSGDDLIDITNPTYQLEANSFAIRTNLPAPAPPLPIDPAPQDFTPINFDPDCDLSVTKIVDATNYVVNTEAPLISEKKINSYADKLDEPAFNSDFNNGPETNFNCVKIINPYVLLKRLTFEELELASAAQCVGREQKCQNLQTDSTSDYSDHSQSDIESDYDPDFDPSDIDSDSNFEPKSVKSKPKKRTFPKSRFEVNEITSQEVFVYNTIRCLVCNISFRFEDQLRRHNLQKHSNTRIKCTYLNCNKTLSCNRSLKRHLKSHENSVKLRYVFPSQLDEDGTGTDNQDHLPLSEWLQNQPKIDNMIILESDPVTTENLGPISLTNPIFCKLCSKGLTSETEVKIHVKNCWTHNTKRHKYCVPCKKSLSDPEKLKFHKIKFHSTEEEKDVLYQFKCKQCNKKFLRLCDLKYHQETHESRENRMYYVACHVCGKPDVHKSYLEDHLATHSNERPFICPQSDCTVTCKSKMALGFHRRKVHAESRPFKCSQCSYTAKSTYDLKMHSFVHTKEKQFRKPLRYFRCTQNKCDKKYASRKPLKIHMKKCHNIGPDLKTFCCQICKKTFASATTLKNHSLIHTGTREFKCTFAGCGADFKRKHKLVEHEREHSGIKLYVCETCGKSYSKLVSFHKHKKSHESLMNQHLCSYCPRKFPGSWELKQHLLVHEKGAQFVCQFCGKKCSKKENLKIHEQSHDNPKKIKQKKEQGAKKKRQQKKCTDHLSSSSVDSEDSE